MSLYNRTVSAAGDTNTDDKQVPNQRQVSRGSKNNDDGGGDGDGGGNGGYDSPSSGIDTVLSLVGSDSAS